MKHTVVKVHPFTHSEKPEIETIFVDYIGLESNAVVLSQKDDSGIAFDN
jgi:hypothetical protein